MNDWINRVFCKSSEDMSEIPDASVHCAVTSPPYYGLRNYHVDGQIGREDTVEAFVERLVVVFREARRVLRDDGTAWVNLGDSYATRGTRQGNRHGNLALDRRDEHSVHYARQPLGFKNKDLLGIPWRVAIALQADGWYLRDAIVWAKPNPMPSSVIDRCTSSYEMVFMLAKSRTYYADMDAVREPLAESSLARLEQARLEQQAGSMRANGGGKTNGPMKAVFKHDESRLTGQRNASRVLGDAEATNRLLAAGANLRNVWTIATTPHFGDHPAVMPRALATRCILIGCPPGGVVLDPFAGSGTALECAIGNGRRYVGYEINGNYCLEIEKRLGLFGASAY